MHILWSLALIFSALVILVLGLAGVVHELLNRGPYEPPLLLRNDGLAWPARYQGSPSSSLQPARNDTRLAAAAWSERGSNRH